MMVYILVFKKELEIIFLRYFNFKRVDKNFKIKLIFFKVKIIDVIVLF